MDPSDQAALPAAAQRLATLLGERQLHPGLTPDAVLRTRQLRDQLEGHVLPRIRSLEAPLLVLILGPTGAGKSSLLNALAGFRASASGVIRPTTRDIVVVSRPEAETALLGPDAPLPSLAGSRLRWVASVQAPEGIALVDSPDLDSVERGNRELTTRLAEAADLGIFVTTASRYADRVPWEALARARDRGLPLLVIVNRMPADASERQEILGDLRRLLEEQAVHTDQMDLVAIGEGETDAAIDGLAATSIAPIRRRIAELGESREARRELAARALAGSLAGLAPAVERVADDLEHEAIEAEALRRTARHAFDANLAELRERLAAGTFLRAEALRQWQAFVGADQITRLFSSGIGKIRGTIAALIRGVPAAPIAEVRDDALADLVALARQEAGDAARRAAAALSGEPLSRDALAAAPELWGLAPDFEIRLRRGLEAWLTTIGDDVRQTGGSKRIVARGASIGVNAAGVGVMLATFSHSGGLTGAEMGVAAATAFLNQKLLEALFGEAALVEMIGRARAGLGAVMETAFATELARYEAVLPDGQRLRALAAELRAAATEVAGLRSASAFGAASDADSLPAGSADRAQPPTDAAPSPSEPGPSPSQSA